MPELFPVAGSKIYIGGVLEPEKVDFEADNFATQTWVEIDGWLTMGAYGDTANEISGALINRGRDFRLKGTRNAGNMENVFVVIADDPGQVAARAAEMTISNYAFRIVLPNGAQRMFSAMVMSANEAGGEANTPYNLNVALGINSNIVSVAA